MALFHYVQLRTFAHETEDPAKVHAAVRFAAQDEKGTIEESRVEGSHGNRILILELDVRSAPAAKRLFGALARDDPEGFAGVLATLRERLDENLSFHVRLDKQQAFLGRVAVATDDDAITVRGKLRAFESKRSPETFEASLRQLEAFLLGVRDAR